MRRKVIIISFLVCTLSALLLVLFIIPPKEFNPNMNHSFGDKLDSLDGVYVYYNGSVSHTAGRNKSLGGYNLGIKYQCVEFVKRYYYQHFNHLMPDSYGNAKDFYNRDLKDSSLNTIRDLIQYSNPSASKPRIGDLLIMDGHPGNQYGHVAIVSKSENHTVEIIQQNPGPFAPPRVKFNLEIIDGKWKIEGERILGWLRMK